jgi:hypothetical protein
MSGDDNFRLREAYEDLERYLADQVAPLLVTDSIELLLDYPAALTGESLRVWAVGQYGLRGGAESLSALVFHAVKKIQLFEEFNLLPKERFAAFLAEIGEHLMATVPAEERESLAGMLAYLRQGRGRGGAPTVDQLHRASAGAGPLSKSTATAPTTPLTADELKALRRFTLLVDRYTPHAGADDDTQTTDDAARQMLVLAAAGSTNAGELEARLSRLQKLGIGPAFSRDLVRVLSASIPDWVVRRGAGVEVVPGESIEAVRRAVRLAGDGARSTERWKDLLRSAAENFNQGAYARSVTLLDLADRMVQEREVDRHVSDIARGTAHEAFEPTRVLEVAADLENRPILRRLVEFFPDWSVRELLDALVWQPDPKRRRLVLALLEVWGQEAYAPVLERLATAIAEGSRDPNVWWYLRNLVYLLHRLPRADDVDPKQVLELVGPFSSLEHHPSFQRETLTLLGQLPNGIGAPLLIQRLTEIERAVAGVAPPHELHEMEKVLNTLAAALVRSGSPAARRSLIEHALGNRPKTGNAAGRLRELAGFDLGHDRDALSRLLEAGRALVPRKLLGFVVSRNEETLVDVARALGSTSDPAAKRLLGELAQRFGDHEFGRVAAAALAGTAPVAVAERAEPEEEGFLPLPAPAVAARPRASLAGDLEVFGLPGLLQNLQQSEASGQLLLRTSNGSERATLELVEGRLGDCRCGALGGDAAFYQIFERPAPGSFEFVREPAANVASRPRGTDLMGLLMEAMRRFDEFQRLRALVPDEARLVAGETRPTAPAGEQDGELMRRLWTRLRAGAVVTELDAASEVDAFRARTLLAHWLEEGAARLAPAAAGERTASPSAS